MSYNTIQQFRDFAIPSGSWSDVTNETIQMNLDAAQNLIDASLQRYHQLPLNPNSDKIHFIQQGERTIAAFNVLRHRGLQPTLDGAESTLYTMYSEWVDPENGWLTKFAKGHLRLEPIADSTPEKSEGRSKLFGCRTNIGNRPVK